MVDEPIVFFDERETSCNACKNFGEGAKTWSNFYDVIPWLNVQKRDDPLRQILIVKKVLAEAARGGGLQLRQHALDFA